MSPKYSLRRVFPVLFLMTLLLASLPAQAQPARHPLAKAWQKVAAAGNGALSRIGDLFLGLWQQGATKEGVLIDPNGSPNHEGMSIDPDGASSEEGVTIDPNGRR